MKSFLNIKADKLLCLIGLCCSILLGHALEARQIIAIQGLDNTVLNYDVTIFEDSLNQYQLKDILELTSFRKLNTAAPFNSESSYWLQVQLHSNLVEKQELLLNLGRWGSIQVWIQDQKTTDDLYETSGSLLPLEMRSFEHYEPLIPLTIQPNTNYHVYARLKGDMIFFSPEKLVIKAETKKHFQKRNEIRFISQGLFFGIIIVMALYNFIIFLAVKDISYFYYILSIIGIGLYFTYFYGFSLEYLWPNNPFWDAHSFAFIVPLTGWARIQFTRYYLHTPRNLPAGDQFLKVLFVACTIPMIIAGLSLWFGKDWLVPAIYVIATINFFVLASMLVTSYIIYTKGYKPALFFLIANLLFVLGAILFIFREVNLLPDHFFTRYVVQVGVVAQVVLFSLGLSNRLTRTQHELAQQKVAKERLEREKEIERKLLIEKQKEELEEEVANRTQDLQEKKKELEISITKLRDSEQQLRELNELKDKLFSVIAHDLRSPLSTLDSFLNLLTKHSHKLSPEQLDKLSVQTKQSLANLSLLLDNLLQWAFSHMQSHLIRPEKINLGEAIDHNLVLAQLEANQKSINLVKQITDDGVIEADKDMLDFVLRNLLNNAIKFSNKGGTVYVMAKHVNEQWQISIRDEGVGISEDNLTKVLDKEMFYSSRGTQQEKGIGIGLSLCQEFVQKHGGTLWVESKEGQGATFHFTI